MLPLQVLVKQSRQVVRQMNFNCINIMKYTIGHNTCVLHLIYICQIQCITSPTENDRTTYSDLLEYFKDFRDWQTLAVHILPGNTDEPIDKIRATHNGNVRECKKALFSAFLETGDQSWRTVIVALLKIGNSDLAEEIKQKLGLLMFCKIYINYCYLHMLISSKLTNICLERIWLHKALQTDLILHGEKLFVQALTVYARLLQCSAQVMEWVGLWASAPPNFKSAP